MENIIETVETAIHTAETHVETEAKKVETAIATEVKGIERLAFIVTHSSTKAVADEFNTLKSFGERFLFVDELRHLLDVAMKATGKIEDPMTQVEQEAQEDLTYSRGIVSRILHRIWKAI